MADQANGWIEWTGGDCPVEDGSAKIDVCYRDGTRHYGYRADSFGAKSWQHHHLSVPITAYRVVPA